MRILGRLALAFYAVGAFIVPPMAATSQILVTNITTDTEIHVNGNFTNGDVAVYFNTGAGDKQVTGNYTFMGDIFCTANFAPFAGGPNVTAGDVEGDQCTATAITGVDPV